MFRPIGLATALSVLLFSAVLAGFSLRAAGETCVVEGVGRLVASEQGLRVVEPAAAALAAGDLLLQLNAQRLGTCADLDVTLRLATREGLVPVLALRRGGTLQTVALSIDPAPGIATAQMPAAPAALASPTALRIGAAALGPLREMVAALRRFDQETALPVLGSQAFAQRLDLLRATYAEMASTAPAIRVVEPVLQYYDTAKQIVLYREEAPGCQVDRQFPSKSDLSRSRPAPGVACEYSTGGPVPEWLARHPFLQPAVVRFPRRWIGQVEEAGRWQPDEAIRLLMEKARADTDTIARRLPSDER